MQFHSKPGAFPGKPAKEFRRIAEAVFPNWQSLPSLVELEARYPPREIPAGAMVTRVCPSPTGMMHLGGLYTGLINKRLAQQSGGLFFLRIEDTDQRRTVKGALDTIVDSMDEYSLRPSEGLYRDSDGNIGQKGEYGPYIQTQRKEIYHAVAFQMMCSGFLYPCFLTEEEIDGIRDEQRAQNLRPGIYGPWAEAGRSLGAETVERRLGENQPFVVRLHAGGTSGPEVSWDDAVRGRLTMPANIMDNVLIKSDGIPTYHFAHLVDDHFMHTTHVIRAEEWIPSVPLHLQLHAAVGWRPPVYGHIAAIYKQHQGSRRKLSKRSDPEADVRYYWETGFPREAVLEYLTNLANSTFEDWRAANPGAPLDDFRISLDGMAVGGPLSDLDKLKNVSRHVISRFTGAELFDRVLEWTRRFEPELALALEKDRDYSVSALEVHQVGKDHSKRFVVLSDVRTHLAPFFDAWLPPVEQLNFPENVHIDDRDHILREVEARYSESLDSSSVFPMIQEIAKGMGFAESTKEYKKVPGGYRGQVGDVAMVIRVALFGSRQSPDLGNLMTVLGREGVRRRVDRILRK